MSQYRDEHIKPETPAQKLERQKAELAGFRKGWSLEKKALYESQEKQLPYLVENRLKALQKARDLELKKQRTFKAKQEIKKQQPAEAKEEAAAQSPTTDEAIAELSKPEVTKEAVAAFAAGVLGSNLQAKALRQDVPGQIDLASSYEAILAAPGDVDMRLVRLAQLYKEKIKHEVDLPELPQPAHAQAAVSAQLAGDLHEGENSE